MNEKMPELHPPIELDVQISLGDHLIRRICESFENGDFEGARFASEVYDETKAKISSELRRQDDAEQLDKLLYHWPDKSEELYVNTLPRPIQALVGVIPRWLRSQQV